MSADRRTVCPRCEARKVEARKALYGKVSEQEYLASLGEEEEDESLEEYWHLATTAEGLFRVEYECSCDVCQFQFTFKHQEQLELEKK